MNGVRNTLLGDELMVQLHTTNAFQIVAGSVLGRDHANAGKNNQDAAFWIQNDTATVLIVCDGCSSSAHSEAGAWAGAQIVCNTIAECIKRHAPDVLALSPDLVLEDARRIALSKMRDCITLLGINGRDELLFTIVGALMTEETTVLFSIGDGLLAINGEVIRIGPYPGNAPPYLAYGLDNSTPDKAPRFDIHRVVKTRSVQSLLIGTDGVADLQELTDRTLPGRYDTVGPLEQFWQDDRYFKNADMIRRRLALLNRCAATPDWERRSIDRHIGLLRDDTTLIVARRVPQDTGALPVPQDSAVERRQP
jgi:hypothetical protein